MLGLPNSLLKAAAPMGPSVIICRGVAIRSGFFKALSHARGNLSSLKLETLNPTSPILGLAPVPVAPSSLISPPDPVAAPGNGDIAVG